MDGAEGLLLLQEIDAESTDVEDLEAIDKFGSISRDEQKQALRDQLKKSLNQQVLASGKYLSRRLSLYSWTKDYRHNELPAETLDLNFDRRCTHLRVFVAPNALFRIVSFSSERILHSYFSRETCFHKVRFSINVISPAHEYVAGQAAALRMA